MNKTNSFPIGTLVRMSSNRWGIVVGEVIEHPSDHLYRGTALMRRCVMVYNLATGITRSVNTFWISTFQKPAQQRSRGA